MPRPATRTPARARPHPGSAPATRTTSTPCARAIDNTCGIADPPRIALLPGDGIGPEIVGAARRMLEAIGEFEYSEHEIGGHSIDMHGTALTDEVLDACRAADAVLLGAVGGPRWDSTD